MLIPKRNILFASRRARREGNVKAYRALLKTLSGKRSVRDSSDTVFLSSPNYRFYKEYCR